MKNAIIAFSILGLSVISVSAQEIRQNEVPSVILNHFQRNFSKASDVEWEIKGDHYEVEFETGVLGDDHKILYSRSGKIMSHEEEISKSNLPKAVSTSISKSFPGYRIDDVKKISDSSGIMYKAELKNSTQKWKVAFDSQGKILQKRED